MGEKRPHQQLTKVAEIKLPPARRCELCGEKKYGLTPVTVEYEGVEGTYDVYVCVDCLDDLEYDFVDVS